MEYLIDLVTTVPEGTSPDELRASEAVRAAELAIWSGSGVRHLSQANGPALGFSEPLTRQSFVKSSTRYLFMSG
jgi:hypothetical protein